MELNQLRQKVISFRDERDWGKFNTVKNLAIAIGVEAAELNELFLWKSDDEVHELLQSESHRSQVADELADVFIYLLAMAEATNLDLADCVVSKLEKNASKYPIDEFRGSSRKYNVAP